MRGLRRSNSTSAMRFMVMAAERAPTIANDDPQNLPPGRQSALFSRGQQSSHEGEGKGEHGVLDLDHLENGANLAFAHGKEAVFDSYVLCLAGEPPCQ